MREENNMKKCKCLIPLIVIVAGIFIANLFPLIIFKEAISVGMFVMGIGDLMFLFSESPKKRCDFFELIPMFLGVVLQTLFLCLSPLYVASTGIDKLFGVIESFLIMFLNTVLFIFLILDTVRSAKRKAFNNGNIGD